MTPDLGYEKPDRSGVRGLCTLEHPLAASARVPAASFGGVGSREAAGGVAGSRWWGRGKPLVGSREAAGGVAGSRWWGRGKPLVFFSSNANGLCHFFRPEYFLDTS